DGQQAVLQRIAAEDVGDLAADHRAQAEVEQRPRRVLARGAAAEVAAGDQDLRVGVLLAVEREAGVRRSVRQAAPVVERVPAEALALGRGEEARGDDLVGVDVAFAQDHGARDEVGERLHHAASRCSAAFFRNSRGSVISPVTAHTAAVSGEASTVRAPLPWRPSKLRLLVETASCPGCTRSPFMAMHIEQPGSRHSAPAARTMASMPSASASFFTCSEPGTTSMRTRGWTLRPFSTPAA